MRRPLCLVMCLWAACGDAERGAERDAASDGSNVERDAATDSAVDIDAPTADAATADAATADAATADAATADAATVDAAPSTDAAPGVAPWVTYLGGTADDVVRDVAVDRAGNLIVVGGTQSTNFPTTAGAHDRTFNSGTGGQLGSGGAMDAFVAKFSPSGRLLWSTFLGGPSYDRAYAVEVDAAGEIYIAGRAGPNFPTTAGVLQPVFAGDVVANGLYGPQDGFIAKLSSDGATLRWATYFGGTGRDFIRDLDLDATGIYVGAAAVSRAHPHVTTGAFDTSLAASYDIVAAKVALDGRSVLWGTYVGGNGDDGAPAVRVASDGSLVVVAGTTSTNLPTTAGVVQPAFVGGIDLYLTRIRPDGRSVAFLTYLGGSGNETQETHQLALAGNGDVVVVCPTSSTNIPTTAGAVSRQLRGALDGYVARVSGDGARVVSATYLSGGATEGLQGVAVDAQDRIYVGGPSASLDFVASAGAYQRTAGGGGDAVVARLSPNLGALDYLSYLGGSLDDQQRSLWITAGGVVSVGQTNSTNFPVTAGAAQGASGGTQDAYLAFLPIP